MQDVEERRAIVDAIAITRLGKRGAAILKIPCGSWLQPRHRRGKISAALAAGS
ncbi:MAG: hypothetical protein JWN92_410 [Candidatus Acidoferrum typicum]|nr:hypothetical protein [Candidatus Acidoferrum typicum]